MNWTFKSYFHHITTYFKYLKYNSSYTNLPHCLFVFIISLIRYLFFSTIKSHIWVVRFFINKFDHHFHSFHIIMHLINALGKFTILPLNFLINDDFILRVRKIKFLQFNPYFQLLFSYILIKIHEFYKISEFFIISTLFNLIPKTCFPPILN